LFGILVYSFLDIVTDPEEYYYCTSGTLNGLHGTIGTVNKTLNGLNGTIGTVNGTLNGLHGTILTENSWNGLQFKICISETLTIYNFHH
jgi:hypothetical protein